MMTWGAIVVAVGLLAAGVALLVRGVRGRRIDDHPLCRRCGFDLIGLPAGAERCSECGADVRRPRAIRIGHRRRRPGVVVLGIVLILPTFLGSALVGWGLVNHVKWIEKAPLWYVSWQARSVIAADRDEALTELIRRISAAELSAAQVKGLTDAALSIQADLNKPWTPLQGNLIEAAWTAGILSVEDRKRYFANAPQFKLVTRPQVRRGDDLPVSVVQTGARSGTSTNVWVWEEIDIDGDNELLPPQVGFGGRFPAGPMTSVPGASVSQHLKLDPARVAATPDGTKTLRVTLKLEVGPPAPTTTPPLVTTTRSLSAEWELVPAGTATVRVIDDPAARERVEAHAKSTIWIQGSRNGSPIATVLVSVPHPPHPLAHLVVLRDAAGHEWPIGGIFTQPGRTEVAQIVSNVVSHFSADEVDVVLRPDEKTALNTVELHEYWGGEAVIRGIPVQYRTPR
jgi:hypothetical protein